MRTIVGTAELPSARLFTFGDVDGRGPNVRLQHPLGLTYYESVLYVTDTYNNKIKTIDPASGDTRTLVGSKTAGRTDDPPAFNEPGGITAAGGKLFVADTDNHLVRTRRSARRQQGCHAANLRSGTSPSGVSHIQRVAGAIERFDDRFEARDVR